MELDKALQFAVILAWEDLAKVSRPCAVRVEYLCEPGTSLDYLSVWSTRAGGNQYLVCDYWTWTSPAHPSGVRFRNGHGSEPLTQALDFIMKSQDQFTRPATASRHGLVLISPPAGDERAEAAAWMKPSLSAPANLGGAAHESVVSMPSMAGRTPGIEPSASWTEARSMAALRLAASSA